MQDKYKQLPDGGDGIMNGAVVSIPRPPELESPVMRGRFGSVRKASLPGGFGLINPTYIHGEGEVIHESIEIMKDLPVLHVEHCQM